MDITNEPNPGGLTEDSLLEGGAFSPVKQGLSENTENTEDFTGKDGSRARARTRDQSQKSPPCPPGPPALLTRQAAAETAAVGLAGWAEIARPNSQPTPAGVGAYATAQCLDRLAQGPLERLAELWTCEECHAPVGRPCEASTGPHGARLEEAAAARAEWILLRSPDGRAAHRIWDRTRARAMPSTALYEAAQRLDGAETDDTPRDDAEGQRTPAEGEEMDR